MSIERKLWDLRKIIDRDEGMRSKLLSLLESGFSGLEDERHALVHGYASDSALGHVIVNVRNRRVLLIDRLPDLFLWAAYLREVAELWYHDETCEIYQGIGTKTPLTYLPAPPAPYRRHCAEGSAA